MGGRAAVRDRLGELGVDRDGGDGRARTASAGRGRGGLARADDRRCCGAWGGRFGHAVRRCVGVRPEGSGGARPPSRSRHLAWGWWARCCCAWFFLRSLRAAGVVVAPVRTPRARGQRWSSLFVATDGRARLGRARRHHHRRRTARARQTARRRRERRDRHSRARGHRRAAAGPDRRSGRTRRRRSASRSTRCRTLLGGAVWAVGVLVIALLASRRTPLPRGWEAVHRVVRPAVSALVDGAAGGGRGRARGGGVRGDRRRPSPADRRARPCSARPTGCGWASRSACSCHGTARPRAHWPRCCPTPWTSC